MRTGALIGLLLFAGCADIEVRHARTQIVGMSQSDLIACAGIPDSKLQLGARRSVLEWTFEQDSSPIALTLPENTSLAIGGLGKCEMAVTMQDGVAVHVAFNDHTFSIVSGFSGACGVPAEECLRHPAKLTPLPDETPMGIFGDGK